MNQKEQIEHLIKQRQVVLNDLAQKLTKVVALRKSREPEIPTLVLPNLYIGSYASAVNKGQLQQLKITNIVSCIGHLPVPYPNPDIKCLQLSFKDSSSESIQEYLNQAFTFIQNVLGDNQAVLVHCFKGVSRSSALIIGYLIKKLGITADQALEMLRSKYSQANPNKGFMDQLRYLGQRCAKAKQPQVSQAPNNLNQEMVLKQDIGDIEINIPVIDNDKEVEHFDLLDIQGNVSQPVRQDHDILEIHDTQGQNKQSTAEVNVEKQQEDDHTIATQQVQQRNQPQQGESIEQSQQVGIAEAGVEELIHENKEQPEMQSSQDTQPQSEQATANLTEDTSLQPIQQVTETPKEIQTSTAKVQVTGHEQQTEKKDQESLNKEETPQEQNQQDDEEKDKEQEQHQKKKKKKNKNKKKK